MAYIPYVKLDQLPEEFRLKDEDNIIRVQRVHPRAMRDHYQMYVTLMRRPGPLARSRREMIAVLVSALNECRY